MLSGTAGNGSYRLEEHRRRRHTHVLSRSRLRQRRAWQHLMDTYTSVPGRAFGAFGAKATQGRHGARARARLQRLGHQLKRRRGSSRESWLRVRIVLWRLGG